MKVAFRHQERGRRDARATSSRAAPRWSPVPRAGSARRWPPGSPTRGSHLVLLDRDADGLAAVAAAARAAPTGVRVAEHVADLADPAAAVAAGTAIAAAHPETTLLVNNAGVALAGRFDQVDADQFDAVIAVNFQAVVTMTRALLPVLTAHPGVAPRRAVQHLRDPRAAGPDGLLRQQVRRPRVPRVAARRAGADGRRGDLRAPGRGADEHRAQRDRRRPGSRPRSGSWAATGSTSC